MPSISGRGRRRGRSRSHSGSRSRNHSYEDDAPTSAATQKSHTDPNTVSEQSDDHGDDDYHQPTESAALDPSAYLGSLGSVPPATTQLPADSGRFQLPDRLPDSAMNLVPGWAVDEAGPIGCSPWGCGCLIGTLFGVGAAIIFLWLFVFGGDGGDPIADVTLPSVATTQQTTPTVPSSSTTSSSPSTTAPTTTTTTTTPPTTPSTAAGPQSPVPPDCDQVAEGTDPPNDTVNAADNTPIAPGSADIRRVTVFRCDGKLYVVVELNGPTTSFDPTSGDFSIAVSFGFFDSQGRFIGSAYQETHDGVVTNELAIGDTVRDLTGDEATRIGNLVIICIDDLPSAAAVEVFAFNTPNEGDPKTVDSTDTLMLANGQG